MQLLASLFVGKPWTVAMVALLFLGGYVALRASGFSAGRRPRPLMLAAFAWALYAAWEWLVLVRSPEADIRADLLLIWPVLAIVSVVALYRSLRRRAVGDRAP